MIRLIFGCTLFFLLTASLQKANAKNNSLKLWYDKPARDWMTEALPVGNGRLGGMIFGDIATEHIQFDEISLWSGDEKETGAYQAFGDLFIDFKDTSAIDQYHRELNIENAVHTVTFRSNGVSYKREIFCSAKDQVMVLRNRSKHGLNGSASYHPWRV